MSNSMSLQARRELLISIRSKYSDVGWIEKGKILDGFIAATGYSRKHAINLLRSTATIVAPKKRQVKERKYDEAVKQALLTVWRAANQICSKRLVPFIPDFVCKLESCGHLSLPADVRKKLLAICH